MTAETKIMSGVILISIVSIEFGGFFLLSILGGKHEDLELSDFQKAMFRAGHAHAGVLVILAIVCQILADHVLLPPELEWLGRSGVALAALFVSGGFFAAAAGRKSVRPNKFVTLIYAGMLVLAISLIILGAGLIRSAG